MDKFDALDDDERCLLIDLLSRMCCAADNTLVINRTSDKTCPAMHCSYCDDEIADNRSTPESLDKSHKLTAFAIFGRITRSPSFLISRRPRVVTMITLQRLLRHSAEPNLWDMQQPGSLGQWCVQSLQSSLRELRLAAGRALALFAGGCSRLAVDELILERNRVYVVGVLKLLSDKDSPQLHEGCIAAWGQVGRVAPDDELNLVLLQLILYMGHRNTIISAFAFNEILSLAGARRTSPRQLFAPFWTTLGFSAVKDLTSKPQTSEMVSKLLQISVPDLLRLVQIHALPWLILTKKREVIQKIAEARGEKEIWMPCVDGPNLGAIFALLLVQDVPNVEEYCMSLFRHVSPHFARFTLVELLASEPTLTALELFKACGDADEVRKPRVCVPVSVS